MHSGKIENKEYCFGLVELPENWLFPKTRLTIQLIEPKLVYGDKHLLVSIYSHLKGLRLAKDKNMDLLLRITGNKQIKEALAAKPKKKAVLVIIGKNACQEYKKLGYKEIGEVKHSAGELDAIERTALVGI